MDSLIFTSTINSYTRTVNIINDSLIETTESFILNLTSQDSAVIISDSATVYITDSSDFSKYDKNKS